MLLSKTSVRIFIGCANYVNQDIGRVSDGTMMDDSTWYLHKASRINMFVVN
jgi:hypothetical protein